MGSLRSARRATPIGRIHRPAPTSPPPIPSTARPNAAPPKLAEVRRLSGDGRYSSIAQMRAVGYLGMPKIRASRRPAQGRRAGGMTARSWRNVGEGVEDGFTRGRANDRHRRNRAVATRPGEGPDSAPIRPILGGRVWQRAGVRNGRADDARDPPCLDNDEIAGWRRRGHRDANARRGARFYRRWALPHGAFHSTVE